MVSFSPTSWLRSFGQVVSARLMILRSALGRRHTSWQRLNLTPADAAVHSADAA